MRYLVLLSGGVDSAVSALLLQKGGADVAGIHMVPGGDPAAPRHSCWGAGAAEAAEAADRVSARLGIGLSVIDVSSAFREHVLDAVGRMYAAGLTPNPCALCNRHVKLGALIEAARSSGQVFDRVATGHYARKSLSATGRFLLFAGADRAKDQSYFLSLLTQRQMEIVEFPLGGLSKAEVREIASRAGLAEVVRPRESQDFAAGGACSSLLPQGAPGPGPIVDSGGSVLGRHGGAAAYTIGQRAGLGLGGLKEPLYVLEVDTAGNRLVVGPRSMLLSGGLEASGMNWIATDASSGVLRAGVRIRSRHSPAPSTVDALGEGRISVRFDEPQAAVTPGQIAALYEGDVVLGAGVITAKLPAEG